MNVIRTAEALQPGARKVCVAIGVFDGVHLGHQQVIRQTISDAQKHDALSVVITFNCHPSSVVAPERAPSLIYPLAKKMSVIASLGVDTTYLIPFDQNFSQITGEEFIRKLARDFKPMQSVCVGSTFTFGHKRSGNVALLETLGRELNFTVHGLANVSLDGEAVSSTRTRAAIRAGNLDFAGQMLGRAYSLCGKIVRGDGIGHKLGYPTANLEVTGLIVPPLGVYAAHARVGESVLRCAVNIGHRPTLQSPSPKLQVEAHLLDFNGDLYGQEMELTFVRKLRDEKKFPSIDALREQIARDVTEARQLF